MTQRMVRAAPCVAAPFIGLIPASGQNILTNPGFDTDLTGCQTPSGATHDVTVGAFVAGSARWETTIDSGADESDLAVLLRGSRSVSGL